MRAPEVMLPMALANTLSSLQSISDGRVAVHLPHDRHDPLGRAFGEWLNLDQQHQCIAEYLQILHSALDPDGAQFDFNGRYFQMENAGHARRLAAPDIVLDYDQRLSLLAAHADICLLEHAPPPRLEQQIERVRVAATPREPGFALHLGVIVRETAEQAQEAALHSWQGNAAKTVGQEPHPDILPLARGDQSLRAIEGYPHLYAPFPGRPLQLVGSVARAQ